MSQIALTEDDARKIGVCLHKYLICSENEMMKSYVQHGDVSTYQHVINVVCVSYWIARRYDIKVDMKSLITGAYLHDYYLYDWHENGYIGRLHGLRHPAIALYNAQKRFNLNKKEINIILSHMWPLTLFAIPRCKEAFIVCLADKYCTLYEKNMTNWLINTRIPNIG